MTPHIEAKEGEIAEKVIMPGDPNRASFIAKTYLSDVKIVSKVRGNNIYTGFYKGKRVSVISSGMGIPSMGIYAYELFKFYNVKRIIRVGTCGSYRSDVNLFDLILSERTYSETNFDMTQGNKNIDIVYPSKSLNEIITKTAKEKEIKLYAGDVICSEVFDVYMDDSSQFLARIPQEIKPLACEMESYALFYLASKFSREAACLLSVSDVIGTKLQTTTEERVLGLKKMIELALESI